MKITKLIILLFILVTIDTFSQQNISVANIDEYNQAIKKATPGTNIILKNGIWKDVHIKAYGKGEKGNPIIIKSEKAGEVIISGDSKLQIYGEYIIVQGLWFKDGNPTAKSIVSFKKSAEVFAKNCRFTHNTISYYNPEDTTFKSHWIHLWGKNNRVDHNNLTGKTNDGTTLVVWLKGDEHTENNHSIDANFFGPRPELGKNGGETIRIGTSHNSMKSSKTIVENNTFKNCNGEVEIISNKSCDNIYRNNLFIASKGALTLRHGNNALVENNVFLGEGISKTGGIRVINEDHIIRNNLMIGLKGKGNRSPITIMYGVPNSPLNRYNQVKNVNIQNNTLINCSTLEFGTGKDEEKTLAPINTIFANNVIANTNKTKIINKKNNISGISFVNNIVETPNNVNPQLFSKQVINWEILKSIQIPSKGNNDGLISTYSDKKTPKVDILDTKRLPYNAGAFNLGNIQYPKALTIMSGPYWKPEIITPKHITAPKSITVEPGNNTLSKAIKNAPSGSTILLKDGIYTINKEQKINENLTIIGSNSSIIQSNKDVKPFKSFFKVQEGITFNIEKINFDGIINEIKYAIISPSEGESKIYNLFINNCKFKNFKNTKGAVIRLYGNTLANNINIKNSLIIDSFRGLNFYSKENYFGTVNVNNIIIENTVFKNIKEYGIKYIVRHDIESSLKSLKVGNLKVSNCVFSNVDNREKGKIISLKDITYVDIKNSVFEQSNNVISLIRLSGSNNKISNCLISSSGLLKTERNANIENIFYDKPEWIEGQYFTPSKKSILLKENNQLETIGLLPTIN